MRRPEGSGEAIASTREAGAIAIVKRQGEPYVLLVQARNRPREWVFPKGHIEAGETAECAAIRELREEAGIVGDPLAHVGTLSYRSGTEPVSVDYYLVAARHEVGSKEKRGTRWCTLEEAFALMTFPDARNLLRRSLPLIV